MPATGALPVKISGALRQLARVAREHHGIADAPQGRAISLANLDQQRYELVPREMLQAYVWGCAQTSAAQGMMPNTAKKPSS